MKDVLYKRYARLGHVRDHYNGMFGIPRPTEIQFVFRRWEPGRWSRTVYVKTNSELGAKVDFIPLMVELRNSITLLVL